jgi:hypothetical protein
MTSDFDAELGQEPPSDGRAGDAGGGFARTRSLEDVTRIPTIIFENAHEVGMPGAWEVHGPKRLRIFSRFGRERTHGGRPVLPIPIPDEHRNGGSERLAEPDSREHFRAVRLDLHPAAPTVAALPTGKLGIHISRHLERQTGRNSLEKGRQAPSVGFAGGPE